MLDLIMLPVDSKYLALKTFRKNGKSVITPVWFVVKDTNGLFIVTREKTGKVKRMRNNSQVDIVSSNFSGKPKGKWISGISKEVDSQSVKEILKLRDKKYGILSKVIGIFSSSKGKYVVFFIAKNEQTENQKAN